ncbi:MAG TPA: hypothetical protein VFH51_00755, partial [Myxococcota bacterium]|nr:hypothetical protein [Myxococcota bacterium]
AVQADPAGGWEALRHDPDVFAAFLRDAAAGLAPAAHETPAVAWEAREAALIHLWRLGGASVVAPWVALPTLRGAAQAGLGATVDLLMGEDVWGALSRAALYVPAPWELSKASVVGTALPAVADDAVALRLLGELDPDDLGAMLAAHPSLLGGRPPASAEATRALFRQRSRTSPSTASPAWRRCARRRRSRTPCPTRVVT